MTGFAATAWLGTARVPGVARTITLGVAEVGVMGMFASLTPDQALVLGKELTELAYAARHDFRAGESSEK